VLRIDRFQTIAGLTVHDDDASPTTHYVLPAQPTFRRDANGQPIFKYLKYKAPRPREDGKNGGGFVIFDAEYTIDSETEATILEELKAKASAKGFNPNLVRLGTIQWAKGTAQLNLQNLAGQFVEKVFNPASPSLFGSNITPFTVELTQEGSTLFEQALQGKGGVVQVSYQMNAWVKLPPLTGTAWFHSEKFYEFVQKASDDAGWGDDTFTNDIEESLESSQSMGVTVDAGVGVDEKMRRQVEDSLFRTLQDTVAKKMLEQIKEYTGDTTVLEDYETIRRTYKNTRIDDFTYTITENMATLWPFNPQGTLPNITTLVDKNGAPIRWEDYAVEVDLDDPFFRSLNVSLRVNADLEALPINSIDVHVSYGAKPTVDDYHFQTANDSQKFTAFREAGVDQYTYQYVVNYDGVARTFTSPVTPSSSEELTINVDDAGLLLLDIGAGNLDFEKVKSAQVTVRYEPAGSPVIEEQYLIDKEHPTEQLQKAIFEPRNRPITYQITYTMADGQVFKVPEQTTSGRQLWINSPFTDLRQVSFRAVGNLATEIEAIDLDALYRDDPNKYRVGESRTLNAGTPFWDWQIPVLDPAAGVVTYSGAIRRKDGTVTQIPETTATSGIVTVGEAIARLLDVSIEPSLIDFEQVALVKVELRYRPNGTTVAQKDVVIKPGVTPETWQVELVDEANNTYFWSATYFLKDSTQREIQESSSGDNTLVLPAIPPA
jgi:hypothetical protein